MKENMTKEEIIDLLFQNGMGNNELLDFLKKSNHKEILKIHINRKKPLYRKRFLF